LGGKEKRHPTLVKHGETVLVHGYKLRWGPPGLKASRGPMVEPHPGARGIWLLRPESLSMDGLLGNPQIHKTPIDRRRRQGQGRLPDEA
jgi:hypothetical protein